MKKLLLTLVVLSVALLVSANAQALSIPGLYNTGTDQYGNELATGSADGHYSLVTPSGASTAYAINNHSAWVAAPSGSRWIGPINGELGGENGWSFYTTTFDLTGLDHTTASITGNWAVDNSVSLFLNGADTELGVTGFSSLNNFNLNSGFIAGVNTLEYRVYNTPVSGANPTGLLVSGLSGTAEALNVVPEPASMLLLGGGLLGLLGFKKRKKA
jgi:hypothetical protein